MYVLQADIWLKVVPIWFTLQRILKHNLETAIIQIAFF